MSEKRILVCLLGVILACGVSVADEYDCFLDSPIVCDIASGPSIKYCESEINVTEDGEYTAVMTEFVNLYSGVMDGTYPDSWSPDIAQKGYLVDSGAFPAAGTALRPLAHALL